MGLEDNHTDVYGRIDSFDSGTVKTVCFRRAVRDGVTADGF